MIFIYDRDEKQIAHLDVIPRITEEIGKLRTLEFESELEFEKGFRIVADIEDKKAEFIIIDIDYNRDDTKQFSYFCQDSFIEMQSVPILDKRPTGNIESAMTPIFDNTRWIFEIRSTDTINQTYNNSFYHINALEAFAETVEKYRVEWITEFKYVGSKITERRVVIYRRDGRSKGRLEFGKNIKKFSRKILSEPIITALYPYGKGEDLGNGTYGRRIGIESVNDGIPYIENKQATELYGIGEKGSKKPLFAFITFEEETDPTNLKKEAQKELDILSQIRAEHIVEAIDLDIDAKIGYEVAAIDDEISYRGYSRIIKLVRQGDDVEVTFGQVTKAFTSTFQKTLKKTEQGLIEVFEQVNNIRLSADGKTNVFTGPTEPPNANEGDLWYRYNADGTVDMFLFKDDEWVESVGSSTLEALRQDLEESKELIQNAQNTANEASKKIADASGILSIVENWKDGKGLMSAINQQAGNILFEVGDNITKSRINLTKDGAYIDNALIQTAHISDAAVTNAKIKDLSANKLTSGEIDASKIRVINLDANNITSGYLNSDRLKVTSDFEMQGKAIRFTNNGNLSTIIDRERVKFYDQTNNARFVGDIGAIRLGEYPDVSMLNIVHRPMTYMSLDYQGTDSAGQVSALPYIVFDAYKVNPFNKDTYDIRAMKPMRFRERTRFDAISYWTSGTSALGMVPYSDRFLLGNTAAITGLMFYRTGGLVLIKDGKGYRNLSDETIEARSKTASFSGGSVWVNFDKQFDGIPVVIATSLHAYNHVVSVRDITKTGFRISMKNPTSSGSTGWADGSYAFQYIAYYGSGY